MCGIAGYIGKNHIDIKVVQKTLSLMKNRGPDFQSYKVFDAGQTQICFLHSRLSIIDLDKRSNQPFSIDGCSLVFNGEIYNYVELKKQMEKEGISFNTSSDTEVLLRYYLKFGEECVKYFEGMWSFAIFDSNKQKVFFSRDRFAEKPFYYLETENEFYFGSEIKFIQALYDKKLTINKQHLYRYLVNGYKSLYKFDATFYEEIKELSFAKSMVLDFNLKKNIYTYWNLSNVKENKNMSLNEAIEGTTHFLTESMRLRLRADVPLAFCLSGGIDSASLTSIAAKCFQYNVATFSIIDQDERYNEYDNIMESVNDLGCKHFPFHLKPQNDLQKLKELIHYHDSPISTISLFVHSFLSEEIAKQGYKVAISGTSADELFTGYYDHFNLHIYEVKDLPDFETYLKEWKEFSGTYVRNPHLKDAFLYINNPSFRSHIYLNNDIFAGFLKEEFGEPFTEEVFCDSLLRNRMLNELFYEVTPVILHEDDLNSMRCSIENRSPFLDSKLFEFAYSIPKEYLIQKGYGKYVLREAVKGILNDKVRLDKRKKGFNASLQSIVDFKDPQTRQFLLDDSPIFDFIKREKIESLFGMNPLPNSYSKFLFYFINVKLFLEMN